MAYSSAQREANQSKVGNCYYCLHEGKGMVGATHVIGHYWVCDGHYMVMA